MTIMLTPEVLDFSRLATMTNTVSIPLYEHGVSAGNPAYVSNSIDKTIDLNSELVINKQSTFCVRVNGQSMIDAGIDDGDLLIVDRDLTADNNSIVLAVVNGDFTVKRIKKADNRIFLMPENVKFNPIEITEFMDFRIWGVVTGVIKRFV
jgi:DNA polymerase V